MTTSGTLTAFFSSALPTATPPQSPTYRNDCLPADVHKAIGAYLEKTERLEEADLQHLQDRLLDIYEQHVAKAPPKLAPFLQCLRLLKPAVKGQGRVEVWWNTVISPVIDGVGHKRVEVEHATEFMLDILENGAGEDNEEQQSQTSSFFVDALLQAYLTRTKVQDPTAEVRTAEDQFVAKQVEGVLITYGKKCPKALLVHIDGLLLKRTHRLQALNLLCSFVRHQPPYLYRVSETPLIEHLIKSLLVDRSTTAAAVALNALVMFLPHIPSSVRTHLTRLFLVYSNLLCWPATKSVDTDAFADAKDEQSPERQAPEDKSDADEWEVLSSSFDTAESTPPDCLPLFTFLYGLYPLNFTSYIHKPRKYLKKINFPRAEDFDLDQSMIRKKSEPYRGVHLLHPNFFNTTLEEELDDDRWLKAYSVDVVAECTGLYVPATEQLANPRPPPTGKLPEIPSQYTRTKDIPSQNLVPEPLRTPQRSTSRPSTPQDDAASPAMLGVANGLGISAPIQVLKSKASDSPRLGPLTRDLMPKPPALRPATPGEANMAYLQREVMLLRSDLNFERYLKQQHLSHIGQLQRKNIKEATVEAETQSMLNNNRTLKAQLEKANESYTKLKRETITGRSQSKKWEVDLSNKVRTLKEDEKKWQIDGEDLRLELSKAQKDCEHLKQLVVDSESRELLAKQELQFAQVKLEQLDTLKNRLAELEDTMRNYQARELEFGQANDEKDALQHELDTANLMIQGRDASAERAAKSFERRILQLEQQLSAAQNPIAGGSSDQFSPQVQVLIDSAVSEAKAKYYSLKKEHAVLRHKYVELDMRYQALREAASLSAASIGENGFTPQEHYNTSGYLASHSAPPRPTTSSSLLHDSSSALVEITSASFPPTLIPSRPAPTPPGATSSRSTLNSSMTALPAIRAGSPLTSSSTRLLDSAENTISPGTQSQPPGGHRLPAQSLLDTSTMNDQASYDNRSISHWSVDSWDATTQGSTNTDKERIEKVGVADQVRVRGRGGAQNIGKPKKGDVAGSPGNGNGSVAGSLGSLRKKGLAGLLGR